MTSMLLLRPHDFIDLRIFSIVSVSIFWDVDGSYLPFDESVF